MLDTRVELARKWFKETVGIWIRHMNEEKKNMPNPMIIALMKDGIDVATLVKGSLHKMAESVISIIRNKFERDEGHEMIGVIYFFHMMSMEDPVMDYSKDRVSQLHFHLFVKGVPEMADIDLYRVFFHPGPDDIDKDEIEITPLYESESLKPHGSMDVLWKNPFDDSK